MKRKFATTKNVTVQTVEPRLFDNDVYNLYYVLIRPAQTNIKYLQTKTQHLYRKVSLATQSSRIFIQSTCVHAHDIAKLKVRKQTGWLPLDDGFRR